MSLENIYARNLDFLQMWINYTILVFQQHIEQSALTAINVLDGLGPKIIAHLATFHKIDLLNKTFILYFNT